MSSVISPTIAPAIATVELPATGFDVPPPTLWRFSVEEYEQLGRLGVLTEDDNVELLEGLIVKKMTKNPVHDWTIDFLNAVFSQQLPPGWILRIQNALRTHDSEPEPDVVVAIGDFTSFRRQHPTGEQVSLVIEVAESSLDQDWRKCRIYARAGVPVYWIVDLNSAWLEVFTQPNRQAGEYEQHVRLAAPGQATVQLSDTAPLVIDLQQLFPPAGE
ncbi:MAG: Uma2 family endonuclease [Pirellulaceae bacterium]|nr:Uma2 family endonuclease [Pirellulaceae bacterium]